MGLDNLSISAGDLMRTLPPGLVDKIENLIFLSKIAVFIFIGYLVFLVIKNFFGWRRNRRIDKMYHKINNIDRKLDFLLKGKKIEKEPAKKKSFLGKLFKKKKKK